MSPRDSATVYADWGKMEADQGKVDQARELYKRGIAVNPSHKACWRLMAVLEAKKGNQMEASRLHDIASTLIEEADIKLIP